jgi:hypothetical protein
MPPIVAANAPASGLIAPTIGATFSARSDTKSAPVDNLLPRNPDADLIFEPSHCEPADSFEPSLFRNPGIAFCTIVIEDYYMLSILYN